VKIDTPPYSRPTAFAQLLRCHVSGIRRRLGGRGTWKHHVIPANSRCGFSRVAPARPSFPTTSKAPDEPEGSRGFDAYRGRAGESRGEGRPSSASPATGSPHVRRAAPGPAAQRHPPRDQTSLKARRPALVEVVRAQDHSMGAPGPRPGRALRRPRRSTARLAGATPPPQTVARSARRRGLRWRRAMTLRRDCS
jgi:hypothetical protein